MSSREANIERLNYAIMTLNEDAEDVHGLITKAANELGSATALGNKAADNAARIIEMLEPLSETLTAQHNDSVAMLEDAKKAADEQRSVTSDNIAALQAAVTESIDEMNAKSEAVNSELKKTAENSLAELKKAQSEAFEEMQTKSLKEHERIRDVLQTDILSFKNATLVHLDALEAGVTKNDGSIKELEGKLPEVVNALAKKIMLPLCVALVLGVANLVCLVMLLLR